MHTELRQESAHSHATPFQEAQSRWLVLARVISKGLVSFWFVTVMLGSEILSNKNKKPDSKKKKSRLNLIRKFSKFLCFQAGEMVNTGVQAPAWHRTTLGMIPSTAHGPPSAPRSEP